MGNSRSCWLLFLVLTLVVLHVIAREVPKPKNVGNHTQEITPQESNNKDNVAPISTLVDNPNTMPNNQNNDDKHFLPFGGVGAAGGIGGVAGVIPIDFLDRSGLGTGFMPGGGLGGIGGVPGGGIGGGAGGAPGGGGGGCTCSGGAGVPIPIP